jgi:copper resistance protein C
VPSFRSSRRALLVGLAVFSLGPVLAPPLARPAAAHALVLSSLPEAGAELARLPETFILRFNSRIDPARSRVGLFGPDNATLPLTLTEGGDPAVLEAVLPPGGARGLAPGAWRLRWQVLAVDGHITRGDIFFTLRGEAR